MKHIIRVSIALIIMAIILIGCDMSLHKYKVKLIFCDDRPEKVITYNSSTRPSIYHGDSVPYTYMGNNEYFNVCEIVILEDINLEK